MALKMEDSVTNGAHILVVDDEVDTLSLLEITLKSAGYRVQTASNGELAIDQLRNDSFDVLLLDIMMPEMSGFDVIQNLNSENITYPPLVFLTARADDVDRHTGDELGAIAYLTKPATRGQLLDAIKLALKSAA